MTVRALSPAQETALVFCGALLLFATTVARFSVAVTDISALRVLDGDVPYRDFWTMYAPGSFTTLALAFAVFGRELLVSNLLGVVTSAGGVALYYRLAKSVCGSRIAVLLAALVAAAFFGTGYHEGFGSYPPAFLLILAAANLTASRVTKPGSSWAVVPGLLIGSAALFKHDIAAYAGLAGSVALVVVRYRSRVAPVLMPALVAGGVAAAIVGAAVAILTNLGAGPDLWRDLVEFPLTDFRHVRPERIPLVPQLHGVSVQTAQEIVLWGTCNLPILALVAGAVAFRRGHRVQPAPTLFLSVLAFALFWFHYAAAHVQLNTNAISLTAWGALVAGAGLRDAVLSAPGRLRLAAAAIALWSTLLVAETAYIRVPQMWIGSEWLQLPQLNGIKAPHRDAAWIRGLTDALADSDDPRAPLLFLSSRNDVHVYAKLDPLWLTRRPYATGHHELHPGVTDTETIQRQDLARLREGPWPVVVREHRFPDAVLDNVKARFARSIPVGSQLIDEWIAQHYVSGARFGRYELMKRK